MNYIYAIKNLVNNKVYIGSTKSLLRRKYAHFYMLKNNKHYSTHLQNAYNLHGKDKFAFYMLEECSLEQRAEREIYHINVNRATDTNFGYNQMEPNGSHFTCPLEIREKLKESSKTKSFQPSIPVDVYRTNGTFLESVDSLKDLGRKYNIPSPTCSELASGKRKSYKGYVIVRKGFEFNYKISSKSRDMTKFYKK